jgi:hypothetical protein
MIPQALDDLPGLRVEQDGQTSLSEEIWTSRAAMTNERLARAFQSSKSDLHAFEAFEPSASTSSSWQAFLWELQERRQKIAKIQLAGPMTCQWTLRLSDGTSADRHADISSQIFRLVLARALAMTRRLQASDVTPILFLDEPGLYAYSSSNPKHVATFQELKLMVQTLRKEGVVVGLHCCSNADWRSILTMELNYLSLDTNLSLGSLLTAAQQELVSFLDRGGRLALGVIPTGRSPALKSLNARDLYVDLKAQLLAGLESETRLRQVLSEALYTPACGLALQSIPDAELISDTLQEFFKLARNS